MTNHNHADPLQLGETVFVFPGWRKHSRAVRIEPTDVCQVVGFPTGAQPADTVAILLPNGDVAWVDADLVGRVGG